VGRHHHPRGQRAIHLGEEGGRREGGRDGGFRDLNKTKEGRVAKTHLRGEGVKEEVMLR